MTSSPLKDKWIVITRPKHQAENLRLKLEAEGANVILFPLLGISLPNNISLAKQQLNSIEIFDLVIFTSANAVDYALKWLDKSKLDSVKIAAIGKKTAKLLESYNISVDFFPKQGFNSEALLGMPEIHKYNKENTIAILRGENGRDFLKRNLEKQCAKVTYIDVYKRVFPHQDISLLNQYFNENKLDIILITSGTSLINLFNFLPQHKWLSKIELLVGSERIKKQVLCYSKYQKHLNSAVDPSDETLFQQLLIWGDKINKNG